MPSDAALLTELAVAALGEVTEPATVGPLVDAVEREPGVIDLGFACLLPGYPGWRWTVSTAHLDGAEPTVLEVELLPGDGALLAPPWTPWAERLAEYRRTHGEGAATIDGLEDGDDEDLDDADGLDEDDDVDDELGDDADGEFDEDENGDLDGDDDPDDGLDDVDDELDDDVDVEAAAGLDEDVDGDEPEDAEAEDAEASR